MSFSSDVKTELCRQELGTRACAAAECYGILLYCHTFSASEIRIVTGLEALSQRLIRLFRRAFGVEFDEVPENIDGKKHVFLMTNPEKTARILDYFGCNVSGVVTHHLNLGALEDEGCRESFIRGVFLAGGSVTDPMKRYHLELVTSHFRVNRELAALLIDMGFEPKTTCRNGNYITYFKQSAVIEDLLTTIGAPVSAMGIMSAKIEKDMTNSVNRLVNCDTANVFKTVEASGTQLAAISRLREKGMLESLPEKIRQTAIMRERYPEYSLSELAQAFEPPISKSCLNHRLRKIAEASQHTEKEQ